MNNKEHYKMPDDVRALMKTYPVSSKNFSVGLLKLRYDRMDSESQRRAEKSLMCLTKGYNFS